MISILLMLAALNTKTQDIPKIDQYCELLATGKFLSYKVTMNHPLNKAFFE